MRQANGKGRVGGRRNPTGRLIMIGLACLASLPALAQFDREAFLARSQQQQEIQLARQAAARAAQGSLLVIMDNEGNELASIGLSELNIITWEPSPDARYVAQLRQQPSADPTTASVDIYLLDVTTGETTRLTESGRGDTVVGLAWSPDSRELAFVARRDGRFGVYRYPVSGPAPDGGERLHESQAAIGMGHWSPDGRYITFATDVLAGISEGSYIAAVDLESDDAPAIFIESDRSIIVPRFSPDGRYQLFFSFLDSGEIGIFAADAAPGGSGATESWQLPVPPDTNRVLFSADGQYVYFCGSEGPTVRFPVDSGSGAFRFEADDALPAAIPEAILASYPDAGCYWQSTDGARLFFEVTTDPPAQQVVVLDRRGVELARFGEPRTWGAPSFSPDGSQIVAALLEDERSPVPAFEFWTFDVTSGESKRISEAEPLALQPVWLPGGDHIGSSFIALAPPVYAVIYRLRADGEGEPELLWRSEPSVLIAQLVDVSPDNRYLAISEGANLVAVPMTGSDPSSRESIDMLRGEFDVGGAQFSPDSRHLAFMYNDTGWPEIYVAPFDGATGVVNLAASHRVSHDGAAGGLSWRQDGREIFYLSDMLETPELNDFRMIAVSVDTEEGLSTSEPEALFEITLPITFTANGGVTQSRTASPDGERFVLVLDAFSR